jgi:hypothetical protein
MKFAIYLLILNITLSVCSSLSLSTSSSAKTDLNFKLSTVSRTKFELTFSSSNSIPESTKMLESVIKRKSVKVQARVSIIGEDNQLDNENNKVSFSEGNTNLRFKQNEQMELKNMESPEIRKMTRETQEENIGTTGATHLATRLFNSEKMRNLENDLLMQFKQVMGRTLHKQTEIIYNSKVKIIQK